MINFRNSGLTPLLKLNMILMFNLFRLNESLCQECTIYRVKGISTVLSSSCGSLSKHHWRKSVYDFWGKIKGGVPIHGGGGTWNNYFVFVEPFSSFFFVLFSTVQWTGSPLLQATSPAHFAISWTATNLNGVPDSYVLQYR